MFAVGITLWEMLCSRKLFTAPNDLAVLKEVQACKIPAPSSVNPNVPQELDEIVLKALQKDRELRFADMDAFNRALVRFLYSKYPDFNATDLAFFAKELFKEDIKKDREKLKEYGKMDIARYISDYENSLRKTTTSLHSVDSSTVEALIVKKKNGTEIEIDPNEKVDLEFTRTTNNIKLMSKIHGTQQKNIAAGRGNTRTRAGGKAAANRSRVYKNDAKQSSSKLASVILLAILGFGAFHFRGDIKVLLGMDDTDNKPIEKVDKRREISSKKMGKLFLQDYDPVMEIRINGQVRNYSPLGIPVPTGKKLQLKVSMRNKSPFEQTITVDPRRRTLKVRIPTMHIKREGLLTTSMNYPQGSRIIYFFDGKRFEKKLPLKNARMPAGIYEAVIDNPVSGTKRKLRLRIEENKKHFLE
jgi:serine/threonine-protein kinase